MFNPAPKPKRKIKRKVPIKKTKVKKGKTVNWLTLADKWFSLYIRIREADDNLIVQCFTCGIPLNWRGKGAADKSAAQCGHFVKRNVHALRYSEENCHVQCSHCNKDLQGNDRKYTLKLVAKYSLDFVLYLDSFKGGKHKSKAELQQIALRYYDKVNKELVKRNRPELKEKTLDDIINNKKV